MGRIFKLIGLEISFLKRTIILIGLILTAFVAALLSVISVLLDVPEGMYAGLDETLTYFTVTASDATEEFAMQYGGTPLYGTINGVTRYATLAAQNTLLTHPPKSNEPTEEDGQGEQLAVLTLTGYAVCENAVENLFSGTPYTKALTKGSRYPSAPGEIALSSTVANLLGASVGDIITIGPDLTYKNPNGPTPDLSGVKTASYVLVGLYSNGTISTQIVYASSKYVLPSAHYYLIPQQEGTVMTRLCFSYPDSRTQHAAFNQLLRDGFEDTSANPERPLTNIALAQAFFGAISCLLGAMVLFILYTLIAIFYRQRKSQICRLKLLGATSGTISGVYCLIAVALTVVAVAIGTCFSMLFNIYFMNLCGELFTIFSANFVSHFRPEIPLLVLLVLIAFSLILFFIVNKRISNAAIAQEVRHE